MFSLSLSLYLFLSLSLSLIFSINTNLQCSVSHTAMDKNCVLVSVLQIPRHHGIRFKKFDTYFGILQANHIVFTISLPKLLPKLNRS